MPDFQQRVAAKKPYKRIRRKTDLSRRANVREQRWTVLVVSNGEKTEIDYFQAIRLSDLIGPDKRLVVRFRSGSPLEAVRSTIQMRDSSEYDEAWTVCDVDEYNVADAMDLAASADVGLALSQPSFEVWLILHCSARCPGLNNAKQAVEQLRRHVPNYDKTDLRFVNFEAGIAIAVRRAEVLGDPPAANPSTAVWRVIVALGIAPHENGNLRPAREY